MQGQAHRANEEECALPYRGALSRREFLRLAGITGAALGIGGAFGGTLAGCGGEGLSTTASTLPPPTTLGSPTTAATRTTTTSTIPAVPREVKIGFVTPRTGYLAAWGDADQYCVRRAMEAIGTGLACGDGQTHAITIVVRDSQSDFLRAAEVAGELIGNEKVDMVVCASGMETVVPVANQCETLEIPCLSTGCPWEVFDVARSYGRVDSVYSWTYHASPGVEDHVADFIDLCAQVPTNQIVGALFPDDDDGNSLKAVWGQFWTGAGLSAIEESGFPAGTQDFTPQIQNFRRAGCEIGYGVLDASDFTTFWKQAAQQSWIPKLATYIKCLDLPQIVEGVGPTANNLCTEVWWSPAFPGRSSLLGQNCKEFASDFEAAENRQWTPALLRFFLFEWAIDALQRAQSVDDKAAIMDAVRTTKLETIGGLLDFTAPVEPPDQTLPPFVGQASFKVGPCRAAENVYKTPAAIGQWRTGTTYPFDLVIVCNKACPEVPIEDEIIPYTGA